MKNLPQTDVVIIGGGWTGLLMAKELGARTSHSMVVLERGAARHKEDYAGGMDELDYNVRFRMMQDYSLQTVTLRYTLKDRAIPIRQLGSFMPGKGRAARANTGARQFPRIVPDVFSCSPAPRNATAQKSCRKITPSWTGASPGTRSSRTTRAPKSWWALPARRATFAAR